MAVAKLSVLRLRWVPETLGLVLIGALLTVNFSLEANLKVVSSKNQVYVAPSKALVHFTLGYNEVMADFMWLRVIQDLGLCEQRRLKLSDPRTGPGRKTDCEKSWNFRMLDVITDLAPKHNMAYFSGATALSVIADDIKGASIIYEKGVGVFPKDWALNYRAATHFLTEVGDEETAAKLYGQAGKHGAPEWVHSLAARLYTRAGKAMAAKLLLEEYIHENEGARFILLAKKRLAEVDKVLEQELKKNPK